MYKVVELVIKSKLYIFSIRSQKLNWQGLKQLPSLVSCWKGFAKTSLPSKYIVWTLLLSFFFLLVWFYKFKVFNDISNENSVIIVSFVGVFCKWFFSTYFIVLSSLFPFLIIFVQHCESCIICLHVFSFLFMCVICLHVNRLSYVSLGSM